MMRRDEGGEVEGGPQTLVNCRSGQGRLEEELCIWQVAQTCQTGVVRIVWFEGREAQVRMLVGVESGTFTASTLQRKRA